jgi:uncharacterized membrane protein YvbJ
MSFLEKLQKKTDNEKKIIIWSVIVIIGLIFIILWVYTSQKSIKVLRAEDVMEGINMPEREDIPGMEQPKEEDVKALEDLINQLNQENSNQENAQ